MSLKSFNLSDPGYSQSLSKSTVMWLDNNFFQDGAYFSRSGTLSSIAHPEYPSNKVFGSDRKNWVWESGSVNVTVGGVSTSNYTTNYRDGYILFNSAINASVYCEYNYKHVNVFDVKDKLRGSYKGFQVYDGKFREDSNQLPAIGVEIGGSNSRAVQLGGYQRNNKTTILLNIYHRSPYLIENISDVLYNQVDSSIGLFDFPQAYRSGLFPIEFNGFLINSSGNYEYLQENYQYTKIRNSSVYIYATEKEPIIELDNNLWHGTVRFEIEAESTMGVR